MNKTICTYLIFSLLISCSTPKEEVAVIIDEPIPDITCNDGIMNGSETGVDCGGNSCASCSTGSLVIPDSGYDASDNYDEYTLVWNDEFSSENISAEKWSFHIGDGCPNLCGWGNNEFQYYTNDEDNVYVKDDNLIIEAKKENIGGKDYSSARIHTDNKFEFRYGRIDIRASMPSATGTWVALWLLNKDYEVQNPAEWWPRGGEIDIMEYLGEDKTEILGTAHYGSNLSNHRFNSVKYKAPAETYDKVYHVFSIIWEEDKITWLVNDVPYHSITPSQTFGQPYPFNDEFFLLMNLSVGGNLPSEAPIPSEYPTFLIIDYVRVYQKNG
ncbi:glycoside hydrolase family 16 protein [uncultured Aquimarina sp.]|uniref:glycoside hydrolase family 16 protein n=1 Tax=uncultured Aquimarina sp. TaxID=575652 RepID=UPI0026260254|nr:glycoside hydrolase family 16 protein [uncultured Aquimarina sp.]